ncbi:hypothetical protein [Novosphingobium sp. P6W]|uniref:hypothetical protein n=1 Tax=Novosphingobium sp. P6W TaxID=1609758 RepID=UPI0005C2F1D3|nr:hypothetical protein [Novosphingobium sp. P6W]AXB79078.1 hypothetical protein TQ38_021250 [Novosphingobium sp. P6W]KIS30439.1 hypothetical protein TQ38_22805 [Novosphingobium sp. P6W]
MSDEKLIAHARRLHGLAAARTGTRADLINLRDLVPQLLERFGTLVPDAVSDQTAAEKAEIPAATAIPLKLAR